MHRIAAELLIVSLAAAVMAGMVLVTGSTVEPPTAPIVLAHRSVGPRSDIEIGCLEAAVTTPSDDGDVGEARLCHDGRVFHLALRAEGHAPGEVYSAWLGYAHQLAPCDDARCGQLDLPSGRSNGLMQQIVGGGSPPSRTLQLDADLGDVQLVRGAQILLRLLRPGGPAGPYAQAIFVVP